MKFSCPCNLLLLVQASFEQELKTQEATGCHLIGEYLFMKFSCSCNSLLLVQASFQQELKQEAIGCHLMFLFSERTKHTGAGERGAEAGGGTGPDPRAGAVECRAGDRQGGVESSVACLVRTTSVILRAA